MARFGYWDQVQSKRLARRRFLVTSAMIGTGAAALALVGCGSDDGGTSNDASSMLYKPAESKATKGGVYAVSIGADPRSFAADAGAGAAQALHAYSRLVRFQAYKYPDVPAAGVEGDAATSWEVSPDGLNVTYKMRQGMKFDSRPPTSGRALDANDVAFSWAKFEAVNGQRLNLSNKVNPSASVVSVTAVDKSTAVFKLAFPYSPLNAMLAFYRHMPIYPMEYDSNVFDPRNDMRGSSAWRLKAYEGSLKIEYEKNPEWYGADKVNVDSLRYFMIPEYATGLSQFRAGAIATYPVSQEDVLATKRDIPSLLMTNSDQFTLGAFQYRFGFLPGSPFFDDRVRKALSMLYDRDLVIDTFGNVEEFRKSGIDVNARWNSIVPGGYGEWLDPKSNDFGAAGKWYKYNPTEAKQLMRAAGHTGPLETTFSYTDLKKGGPVYTRKQEVIREMWQAHGDFKLTPNTPDYDTIYRQNYHYSRDKVDGIFVGQNPGSTPEIDNWLTAFVHSNNDQTGHQERPGQAPTELDGLIDKQRTEFDVNKRRELIFDIQKKFADKMYVFLDAGTSQSYSLAWPWVGNWSVYRAFEGGVPPIETIPSLYLDETKRKA